MEVKEKAICLIGETTVDCNSAGAVLIVAAPKGKQIIPTEVHVYSNDASLAGLDDVNFGGGSGAVTPVFLDAADLSGMTSAGDYIVLRQAATGVAGSMIDGDGSPAATQSFFAVIVSESTNPANAVFALFGRIIDS